jgi:hypothetical protein
MALVLKVFSFGYVHQSALDCLKHKRARKCLLARVICLLFLANFISAMDNKDDQNQSKR